MWAQIVDTIGAQITPLVVGALGSILAVIIMQRFTAGQTFLRRWLGLRLPYQIASVLAEGGITRMTLSRKDYHRFRSEDGVLRTYLATAKHSIDIVSISLNVAQAEGSLISLFAQRICENDNFIVRISLLNPLSPVVPLLAKSLDLQPAQLHREIEDTLSQLVLCRNGLPDGARERLEILIHDTLPIGSAILLDATPESGKIQLETKLYRAPRTESFGFEIVGPSDFYNRNYTAWKRVFRDSVPYMPPAGLIASAPTRMESTAS